MKRLLLLVLIVFLAYFLFSQVDFWGSSVYSHLRRGVENHITTSQEKAQEVIEEKKKNIEREAREEVETIRESLTDRAKNFVEETIDSLFRREKDEESKKSVILTNRTR